MALAEHIAVVKAAEKSIWAVARALNEACMLNIDMTCHMCNGEAGTIRAIVEADASEIVDNIMEEALTDDFRWEKDREEKRIAALPAIEQRCIARAKRKQSPTFPMARTVREAKFDRDLARLKRRWLRNGRPMPVEEEQRIIIEGITNGRCGLDKLNRSGVDLRSAWFKLTEDDVVGIPKLKEKQNG